MQGVSRIVQAYLTSCTNHTDISVVCVVPEQAMRAGIPVRLRTYPVDRNSIPDCTIIEALRATFAIPGLFKPTMVAEPGGIKVSYVGLGSFNPTALLLDEAALVYPDGHITCVTSIGAGQVQTAGMSSVGYFWCIQLMCATSKTATDSERTAQEMSVRFQDTPGIYFRLSVDQGMQTIGMADWKRISEAAVHARTYLAAPENDTRVTELVRAMGAKKRVASTTHLSKPIHHLTTMHF
jgi:predicted acylesterase/phospholipase RssA